MKIWIMGCCQETVPALLLLCFLANNLSVSASTFLENLKTSILMHG